MAVIPVANTPRYAVQLTPREAADLGVNGDLPTAIWFGKTIMGWTFQLAQNVNGDWQVVSKAPYAFPRMWMEGELPGLVEEIKAAGGVKAWIAANVAAWLKAAFRGIFGGRVVQSDLPPIQPAELTAANVATAINSSLITDFRFTDGDADGCPDLIAR